MPEQFCPSCNKESLVLRKPLYDGFTRIGEQMTCAICGHVFDQPAVQAEEPAPAKKKLPSIFSDEDRSPAINLFSDGENKVICRYCSNYTVNPFRQWCGLHRKEVEATDTCGQFDARKADGL